MKGLYLILLSFLFGCNLPDMQTGKEVSYYFDQPAQIWEETLPLGNGRIGMMPDGGIERENVVLNEISLWSGSKQDTDNPYAYYSLANIRRLLFEGRNDEAQDLMYKTFVCKGTGSNLGDGANAPYGSYQLFGNLVLRYTYPNESDSIAEYRRRLNLSEAIASVSFKRGNVNYQREMFTSFSGDLGVIHLVADADRALNFSLGMNRPEHATISLDGKDLLMRGQLPDGVDTLEMKGMRFASRVRIVLPKGGDLTATDSSLSVRSASEAIILVSLGTDYFDKDGVGQSLEKYLSQAESKDFSTLRREHTLAYRSLFDRVSLDLGKGERDHLPIHERLAAFAQDKNDPGLAALYFQFGRYLLISSTRQGLLPPNLQGLWCNTIHTPWNGDYHLNINLQMNHWPAEVTNLSELHLPLIEWTKQQVPSGERTAKAFYNARGWVTHILGNVWEFTAPGEHPSWGATNTSAAWLCEHLYTHYQYTLDKAYLRDVYPTMKGAAQFFVDMLVQDPRTKYLVTAPTTSPENAYKMPNGSVVSICAGSTMDNQILRELFTNTIEAAGILGVDSAFAAELAAKRDRLMPTTIGKDGRIMEWLEPYEEVEPTHRHVSHLYGLYPGNEISIEHTPELAEAARKSLEVRGDQSTGWSMAWKINFWARLQDGDHAYKLLGDLLRPCVDEHTKEVKGGGSYPNLFCAHPPFQIDGNFGGTAGIAEMLIQSQSGLIEFLPALPSAWKNGSFSGLKVRNGGEVSAKWTEGLLTEARLKAIVPGSFLIKLPANSANMSLKKNQKPVSLPVVDGKVTIEAAGILGVDSAFAAELAAKRDRLMPTTIGKDGRIMEWLEPYEEVEPTHRHVSHLYGLYPGNEISIEHTPELAEAARKSLEVRGDQSTGWSMAWKINFWARLQDGDHAYKLLGDLLRPCVDEHTKEVKGGGSYPNLFCAHPPFQIDGNFGGTAGIAEMLIQSQSGLIEFLPALPSAWKNGSFSGLKVRNGGEVSAKWTEGLLTEARLKAIVPGSFLIKLPANSANMSLKKNQKPVSLPVVDGKVTVDLLQGEEFVLQF